MLPEKGDVILAGAEDHEGDHCNRYETGRYFIQYCFFKRRINKSNPVHKQARKNAKKEKVPDHFPVEQVGGLCPVSLQRISNHLPINNNIIIVHKVGGKRRYQKENVQNGFECIPGANQGEEQDKYRGNSSSKRKKKNKITPSGREHGKDVFKKPQVAK